MNRFLKREKMKNKSYLLLTLLCVIITNACTSPQTQSTNTAETESVLVLSTPETPSNLQPQTDNTSYKFLSPTVVQNTAGTMTFEISASLTTSIFAFRVDAFVPAEFEFQYPDYNYPNIYDSIEFSFTPDIEYQAMGGGGGSYTLENMFNLNSQVEYRVLSQIPPEQQFNLKAVIDFGEFTEITEPVTFELLLIVQE
jgi:hypothetical protein